MPLAGEPRRTALPYPVTCSMANLQQLRQLLARIDGRGYKAYKDLQGHYDGPGFTLCVDHVQGDPFAAPSKLRVRMPQSQAALPASLHANRVRRLALEDFLARQVAHALDAAAERRGSGKSGLMTIDAGAQEVLERTACRVRPEWVEARVQVGLPAAGRTVLGRQAAAMLCEDLPRAVEQSLAWPNLPQAEAAAFVECVENQEHVRARLDDLGLVAFVADGALLPRASGASDRPLDAAQAVLFRSPESLRVTIDLPNPVGADPGAARQVTGMGLRRGVTLVVGGGYHGKSTLLKALERGVYPHVPGDGREFAVTVADAVKVRAEDGRRVEGVDITPFVTNLPSAMSTAAFRSEDASGSTSQAANIVEAREAGARLLLLDEDTSATNFMVRDARMQALVHKDREPITPFLDRVRELHDACAISTVLVMGGCGDYFEAADTVLAMHDYLPADVTAQARAVAARLPTARRPDAAAAVGEPAPRRPLAASFDPSRGRRAVNIDARGRDEVRFGEQRIDLRHLEQLVDPAQARAIGCALHLASRRFVDGHADLRQIVDRLEALFDEHGLDLLDPFHRPQHHPGNFARPRKYEVAAAMNRLRSLRVG